MESGTKICSKCKIEKSLSDFRTSPTNKSGRRSECKACSRAYEKASWRKDLEKSRSKSRDKYVKHRTKRIAANREWKARHPGSEKNRDLLSKYGITLKQFRDLLQAQNFLCKICGIHSDDLSPQQSMCVDHCHKTGKIRGILCRKCNVGIGALRDDPDVLEAAAAYLRQA